MGCDVAMEAPPIVSACGWGSLIERTGPDGDSPSTTRDLRMLAYFNGRERGVSDVAALAADAGLRIAEVHAAGPNAVVELAAAA
jgi:hypothetical protein